MEENKEIKKDEVKKAPAKKLVGISNSQLDGQGKLETKENLLTDKTTKGQAKEITERKKAESAAKKK